MSRSNSQTEKQKGPAIDEQAASSQNGIENASEPLMLALPKGRLMESTLGLFAKAGISVPTQDAGRKLIIESEDNSLNYIMARTSDVATYVEYGAADIGVCGLNALRESARNVFEPLLLPIGHCRLSLCGFPDSLNTPLRYATYPRVATSYPKQTAEFFQSQGINAEIIYLKGSVELSPLVGLADMIVDIVETGSTLHANGLVEIQPIMHSQAVLIVNRAANRLKATSIEKLLSSLESVINS